MQTAKGADFKDAHLQPCAYASDMSHLYLKCAMAATKKHISHMFGQFDLCLFYSLCLNSIVLIVSFSEMSKYLAISC